MRFLFSRLVILSLLFFCFQHEILNAQALERDSINNSTPLSPQGFPVIGKANEELFSIYQKSGDLSAAERASIISERIQRIDANTFSKDSLRSTLKNQSRN